MNVRRQPQEYKKSVQKRVKREGAALQTPLNKAEAPQKLECAERQSQEGKSIKEDNKEKERTRDSGNKAEALRKHEFAPGNKHWTKVTVVKVERQTKGKQGTHSQTFRCSTTPL